MSHGRVVRSAALGALTLLIAGVALMLPTTAEPASALAAQTAAGSSMIRTVLLVLHVAGLVLGFGSALLLDLFLARNLYGAPLQRSTMDLLNFGGRVVTCGLILLWVSGLGFLVLYGVETPEKLANPKIWAKLSVVAVLSLNGLALHAVALPRLEKRIGRPVLREEVCSTETLVLLGIACISFVSWVFAFLLGMVRELNGVVQWDVLLLAYISTLSGALGAIYAGHSMILWLLEKREQTTMGSDSRPSPALT